MIRSWRSSPSKVCEDDAYKSSNVWYNYRLYLLSAHMYHGCVEAMRISSIFDKLYLTLPIIKVGHGQ